jgi:teichuronic acid biosynthesis glycosyltransferase TuaC
MSAAAVVPMRATECRASAGVGVLTITPFFPSVQDPARGCFVSEPLGRVREFGIESHVIAASPIYRKPQRPCLEESEWTSYYCLPGKLGLVTSGSLLAAALRPTVLKAASGIHLIHAHAALPCGEAAMLLARELGVPFIVSVHGLDVFADRQAGPLLGRLAKRQTRKVYSEAKRIVCISKKVCHLLADNLHAKTVIIYNGVDPELFSPGIEQSSCLSILSVGNLIPTKDQGLLIRAFAGVSQQMPEVKLEVIGDGPERASLGELSRQLGIASKVVFRGRQERGEVALAMGRCDVFALPSRYEGLGCVYLEAMACAKPAVACTGQGIEEIIRDGENGRLVPPNDEAALTQALLLLLRDANLRKRLGRAARETVVRSHTVQNQAQELARLYKECLA